MLAAWSTAGLLTVCLLAGCGSGRAAPGQASPSSSPTASEVTISPDGFMPDWIEGLTIVHDASEDARCPWSTSYPDVPGAAPLTRAMREDVAASQAHARSGPPADAPHQDCFEPAGTPGLQVGFDFLIASADVVGVRLTEDDSGAGGYRYTKTYWYDGKTRTIGPPLSLFADASLPSVADRIVEELSALGIDTSMARASLSPEYRADLVTDLSFDATGALHARLSPGEFAPGATGPQEVVLPGDEVTAWLSDFGRRAQAQARRPEHRLRLGATERTDTPSSSDPATLEPPSATTPAPVDQPDVDCHAVKCIALTFDDGPGPYTSELLGYLQQYSAHATFFVLGQSVVARPDLVREEIAAGHEVGNHSWSHPLLTRLEPDAVTKQLTRTDDAIRRATGQPPTLVRPPYGATNPAVDRLIARPVILWNRDTKDWKVRNAQRVADTVIAQARPGDIVLLHDIHRTSVQAVPLILQTLTERGYHFVTVSQLFADTPLTPARNYSHNRSMAGPAQDTHG